ncbi:iron-containing alcohol dehydrogenase [Shewanella gelidimarina]|uniref:iron-containing alcohol dehydrogenase n=1 Tax=Shewanella gelidimarina TaxID=56813 RepID=UPI00200DF4F3|nr:iron-containing alcohol dehydrogenase [Shewanella gelidimarina]MCL1060196.1 iron-containing alcohol dehydrogenase [Shewanella gelidimarina]
MSIQHCAFTFKKYVFIGYAKLMKPVFNYLSFPTPKVIANHHAVLDMMEQIQERGVKRPIIITDSVFSTLPAFQFLTEALDDASINYAVFDGVEPDPDFALIEKGIEACKQHRFDAVIAIGGGSSIDAAKVINTCAWNNYEPRKTVGMFKIKNHGAYFVAIPTTAGTGSETTVVSVVTDEIDHQKKQVISMKIVPDLAVLDPRLMVGLPPAITAATGMDALTHAMESYLSLYSTPQLDEMNLNTIRDILTYLPQCFGDEATSLECRLKMAQASHNAGVTFTQTSVGWVHGIAHQLGALYNMPHGLANALVLPYVLKFYIPSATKRLAEMAEALNITDGSELEKANKLVGKVIELCESLNIRPKPNMIKLSDLSIMSKNIINEVYVSPYPVPRYFNSQIELEDFIYTIFNK